MDLKCSIDLDAFCNDGRRFLYSFNSCRTFGSRWPALGHTEAFDAARGVRNCWDALERMGPAPYADLRVREQVGWSAQPQHAIEEYERHAKALLVKASANRLL
jgi:hypothetical protein